MDDEPMWAADRVVVLTPGSAITIPETTNEFAIKGNHLTLVKGNQVDGRIKTDPHKHIHEFLVICDMFKYKDTENEAACLMMFPLSLTGEAKTWLDELNEGTIETWDALRTAFISQFFPLALFDQLLQEIQAFSQHENETLTKAWLRMKEMPRNYHGHNLSKGNIIKIFNHGLNEITEEVLNAAASAENMLVEVGKFTFRVDFVILEMEENSKVPLILGRPFLYTANAVIQVKQKQLNLGVEKLFAEFDEFMAMTIEENSESESDTEEPPFEKITFNTDYKIKTSFKEPPTDLELKPLLDNLEYAFLEEPSFLRVIISSQPPEQDKIELISVLKRHKQAFAWKTTDIPGICPSFCKHKIQLMEDKKPFVKKQGRLNTNMQEVVKKEIVKLLDTGIIYPIADSPWVGEYFQIPIDPMDQEKTTFTFPLGTLAYRQRPFGLCNAPATFQKCMLAIFHDMIEESVEVFMDDFSVFGNSFDNCLKNLDKMLQHCKDANLVLNWEKCHFMVKEGIVLGHKVSGAGLEVDKAKIDVISKLPPPTNVKGIRSFLGHAGFYRRFIKDFSKITRPLTKLLEKDTPFEFNDECHKAFNSLKEKLTCTPVIVSPNWNLPFELMCDASDFAVGAVLEFDIEIKDKKGTENVAADHLSRIENDETSDDSDVDDNFPGETLMEITTNDTPWFADFANYLVGPFSKSYKFKYILVNVDYVSKWAEAQALPSNDARVIILFMKKLFYHFGMPKALISDRDNPAIWSRKLDDALWAFRTAYKTPIGTTPYKLVYRKNYHLPFEIEHRAYWALKNCNPDLIAAGEKRMF
ncbi:reverse transcriptase domain-containing protein [Tanacetum coccineum]|uniref:Reverse transcriptase domain-containing protein n=1 Tax=Tanacetum coccineum TaxID=301880 RepID=A0ABQ5C5K9_9ASTR